MPGRELLLVINPGSTTTKLGIYDGEDVLFSANLDHAGEAWAVSGDTISQLPHRVRMVEQFLEERAVDPLSLSCIVARGGLLLPVKSGAYAVNEFLLQDLKNEVGGRHAANLGGLIAWEVSQRGKVPALIVDPVSVDEFSPEARVSGFRPVPRKSLLHALNIRACARRAASDLGRDLDDLYLVVAHLGGGFSIAPCRKGMLRDVNNSNEEGPFTVERAGTLPALFLLDLFREFGDGNQLRARLTSASGMRGYLGTRDARAVEKAAGENEHAALVWRSLAYHVAREICAMAAAYPDVPDAVVLTGGLSGSARLVDIIREHTSFLGRHIVYPGEDEVAALAAGALRVIRGEESARTYPEKEAAGQ